MKLTLSMFGVSKDLLVLSKKFEDPSNLTHVYKAFYPSNFINSQLGSTNDVDDSVTSYDAG